MTRVMIAIGIVLLASLAAAEVQIENEDLKTPWAVVSPTGKTVSKHAARDKAIEAAVNASESDDGAVYRVVYLESLRVRHVPNGAAPQVVAPDPVPPPPAASSDFDLAPYLRGAQMIYVSPDGTGDGSTPEKAMTLAAAQSKYLSGSGAKPRHVALRLKNGVDHVPAHPHVNNSAGLSDGKPLILCPQDLEGAPPTIRTGFHFKEGYGSLILYGINFDGLVTSTDPNGNVVTSYNGSHGVQFSTMTPDSKGTVRIARCRILNWRQSLVAQNQTGGNGALPIEVWDSIIGRSTASGVYTLGANLRVYNTWVVEAGTHTTKDHGLYLTDSGSLTLENCGLVNNSAAGLKIQTMRRDGPYRVRNNLAVGNGEVAFACNVNGSTTDPWRGVTGLLAEGNVMTDSGPRMFDIGANRRTVYRLNRAIGCRSHSWLFNLQSGGTGANAMTLGIEDVTIEDNTSYNAGAIAVYNSAIREGLTQPYTGVKVRGNVFVQTAAPAAGLPPAAAIAGADAAMGFKGVEFDVARPNVYSAPYLAAQGFAQWGTHDSGRKAADWWRTASGEPVKTDGVPAWTDPGRTAYRYNVEVLGGEATLESLLANIYAGKMTPKQVMNWIQRGYEVE